MANDSGRRDRPSGRPGNVNVNAGGAGNALSNANANLGGFGGDGGWGQNGGEQIRDILHVIFKRKRLILGLFLAVALPGLIATLVRKPSYQAAAKVMISTARSDPTVQPTDLTKLETIQLNESLVNSEVQIVSSRDLLERVVRQLAAASDGSGVLHVGDNTVTFGQQVMSLSTALTITPIKASNVIEIDYKSSDPMWATRVVNRVVDEYLAYHATVHGYKGLPRFYDEQLRTMEQEVRKSADALVSFTQREGIVDPKAEIDGAVRMSGEVTSALRDTVTNISGIEERIQVIRDQIAAQPEIVKHSQYLEVNPVITQLTTQLVDREVDRVSLLRKYTEKDRHVQDNADEITDLRDQLDSEVRDRPTIVSHQLYRTNPIREERLRTLLDLESSLHEMRARQATLDEELSRVNRRLISLREKSVEYDRLALEAKNREDTYELYVKRLQEAKISEAMDEQRLVNVDVVQRPALPLQRVDTRSVSLALSMIAGLVVGLAGAFGREYMSRSLRSEYDVVRHLGLSLLGSISEVPKA